MSRTTKLKQVRRGARRLPGASALPKAVLPGRKRRSGPRVHPAVVGAAIVAGGTVAVLLNRRRIERSMASDDSAWSEIVPAEEPAAGEAAAGEAAAGEAAAGEAAAGEAAPDPATADATAVPLEADAGEAAADDGEVDEKSPNLAPPAKGAEES